MQAIVSCIRHVHGGLYLLKRTYCDILGVNTHKCCEEGPLRGINILYKSLNVRQ